MRRPRSGPGQAQGLYYYYTTTLLHYYTTTLLHYYTTTLLHYYTTTLVPGQPLYSGYHRPGRAWTIQTSFPTTAFLCLVPAAVFIILHFSCQWHLLLETDIDRLPHFLCAPALRVRAHPNFGSALPSRDDPVSQPASFCPVLT
ncbi:hypothetical protein BD289DRAFT_109489 [Coniella lustricola]|uniref:Uncharacterized protein n=1 Tax=Coniella lustricola TaxID=2025994 RepID=A0A2T2ZXE4_9PEZI|nr:hypothetical protein BD289DRAFT_109489 [Coniella lustricola]